MMLIIFIRSLKKHYAILIDWEEHNYIGLTIVCNHNEGYVDISMSDYLTKSLEQLQHPNPKWPQYNPHYWKIPAYSKRIQMATYPGKLIFLKRKPPSAFNQLSEHFILFLTSQSNSVKSNQWISKGKIETKKRDWHNIHNATRLFGHIPKLVH